MITSKCPCSSSAALSLVYDIQLIKEMGLLESRKFFDRGSSDHTKSYRINYDQVQAYKKRLLSDSPIPFSMPLACDIGLNDAIFLHQLDYWLRIEGKKAARGERANVYDNRFWDFATYEQLQGRMPWIGSAKTIQRIVKRLKAGNLLHIANGTRSTKRYSINYEALRAYGFIAPTTPARREFTAFGASEYKLRGNDKSYLRKLIRLLFDWELTDSDMSVLELAIKQHGKPYVLKRLHKYRKDGGVGYIRQFGFSELFDMPESNVTQLTNSDDFNKVLEWFGQPALNGVSNGR